MELYALEDATLLTQVETFRRAPQVCGCSSYTLVALAPLIGAADSRNRGLIILAGSARPFEDVILDQMTDVLSLSIHDPVVRQQQLAVLKQQVELVKDPKRLPAAAATDLPLGVPAAYWLDLNA
jgi:hypothetical protein